MQLKLNNAIYHFEHLIREITAVLLTALKKSEGGGGGGLHVGMLWFGSNLFSDR